MITAAGILLLSTEGRVLLLQRSDSSDMAGTWCVPGGRLEGSEDACGAAIRETEEETGFKAFKSRCEKWTQRIACDNGTDPVDFTTFIQRDVKEFTPTLCPEHVAYSWVDPIRPPVGVHPGCLVSLMKLSPEWNELHVAKAIRDGQLVSPQVYENITFFDVRVTGTGEAYRSVKKNDDGTILYDEEYVWRDPSLYLNPEFLERVNALPVILEHPDTSTLTTEEYRKRTIGALTLPYIKAEEVWAIARVQDEAAAKIMTEEHLSTSPAVSWNSPDINVSGKLKDGSNFLIEGKPTLLDHLAVCWQGVWDKDGGPQGVNIVRGDSMAINEDDLKEILKQNATITAALSGISGSITAFTQRLDSVETRLDSDRKRATQHRIDSFRFSKRVAGETDRAYQERHDSEEKILRADLMHVATGEDSAEKVADKARGIRRDAEEKEEKDRKDAEAADAAKKDEFPPKKADESKKDEDDKDKDKKADESKKDEDDKDKKADEFPDKDKKADASKKDNDGEVMDSKKDDRKDSVADLKKRLAQLEGAMKPLTDEDLVKVGKLAKRCDSIYVALGESMPRLMPGESLIDYHRKLAADLKKHTKYKESELAVLAADSTTFDLVTEDIFRQAEEFAKSPARIKPGELVQRVERMDGGHARYTYDGSSKAWMAQFAGPVQNHAKEFLVPKDNNR